MTLSSSRPIPVILDTDLGTDMDDTWAIAMMLRSRELDVKMIVSSTGDTTYRAKIIARLLETAGRTDIPIAIGLHEDERAQPELWKPEKRRQEPWVKDYDLAGYAGNVHGDGIEALIKSIMASPEPITLIGIAPLTNIAEALKREPALAPKCRFVGMHGSIRYGYGKAQAVAEYNVAQDVSAAQKVFSAPWREMTITPLDTCEKLMLSGENYQSLTRSSDPLVQAILENYRIWSQGPGSTDRDNFNHQSTTLFDTVAIYLAMTSELLKMERMGLTINDAGFVVPDPTAALVNVAIDWKDLPGFENFLTRLLLGA